mgnify:CR=1 FL=1
MKFFSMAYTMNQSVRPSLKHVLLTGLIILLLGWVLPVSAAPPEHRKNNSTEEGLPLVLSKVNVTIEKKSLEHIFTMSGKFGISPETLIIGTDGKEVSIKKMLVPCDAEVSYSVENGGRVAHRINIKRVADGASWQWTSEKPE